MSTTTARTDGDRTAAEAPWWSRPDVKGPYWMLAGGLVVLWGGPRWTDWCGAALLAVGAVLLLTSAYRHGRR